MKAAKTASDEWNRHGKGTAPKRYLAAEVRRQSGHNDSLTPRKRLGLRGKPA